MSKKFFTIVERSPTLLLAAFLSLAQPLSASVRQVVTEAPRAYTSIQDYENILARGIIRAYTVDEAINQLAASAGVQLITSRDGLNTLVHSVNGTDNKTFGGEDGWLGVILRNGQVIRSENFFSEILEDGDRVALYYGDPARTEIIDSFELNMFGNTAEFRTRSHHTIWREKDGAWFREEVAVNLQNIRIHVFSPDNSKKIISTNSAGCAYTQFKDLGVYRYFAEGYTPNAAPSAVHTEDMYFLHGLADKNRVTRGEAAAFIVNTFDVKSAGEVTETDFADMDNKTPNADKILTAVEAGIIFGNGDKNIQPNEPVNLLQFSVMLGRLLRDREDDAATDLDGTPEWAKADISAAAAHGLLRNLEVDWNAFVTEDILKQIYFNWDSAPLART
ncbi:MAG: S-layer homology domain-containing protein [Clostridiales bacterium]|jgi:hypothetical protein|nr:S-layer homology domain-containing protein [Clostridiales bacterium]